MIKDEALKLGLEALEGFIPYLPLKDEAQCNRYDKALTAIKDALAQPEQEPVAWQFMNGLNFRKRRPDDFDDLAYDGFPYWKPLYTTPPQRTWIGLTAKEKHEFRYSHMTTADFIDAIEAKLKAKNERLEKNT